MLSLLVVFKGPIFHFALKKYVSYKVPLDGEWDFNYSYMSLQERGIAFHDISLVSGDGLITCEIGKIFCYAPEMDSSFLQNHFILEDVDIAFGEKKVSEKGVSSNQIRSILKTLRQVEVKSGSLRIPSKKVDFSLGKSISAQKLGTLIFSEELQGLAKIDISSWADKWIMDIEARQGNISYFKDFFDFFMGDVVSKWEIEKGRLDGRAFIAISSENEVKDARFHFSVLDGNFKNEDAGITSSFDRVFIDLNYPTSSENRNFLDNIKFSSSIDGGSIHVYNEKEETRFHFKDLTGFITMDAFTEAAVDISGFVEDNGKVLPVKFLGSPTKKNMEGLELDLALQIDPLFDQVARINVLCSHDNGEFLLKSTLDSLEVRQMMILQECLSLFHPQLREYNIAKGNYSGHILVSFNQNGIKDFSLRNLSCQDLEIYSESKDIRFIAKEISGALELDLFHEKRTLISDWEVNLDGGALLIGREVGTPFYFENTEMKVTTKDGRFIDSYINTDISGIRGRIDIDGSMDRPIFDVLFSSKGENFLQWLTTPQSSYDNEIMISSRIEKDKKDFFGTGTMTLHDKAFSSEVSFEFKGKEKKLEELTFHTEGFLGRFYPFLNEVMKVDWSLEGDFSLHGKYDQEKVLCAFTGRDATYREEHSIIKDAEGSGYFEKDLQTNDWFVDITLSKGNKKLFGGKNFYLKHAKMKISSSDTFFKVRSLEGYMDLDESMPRIFVDVRKFDITKGDIFCGDISIRNEDFELARFIGKVEDDTLLLEESSHFLEEALDLKKCSFKDVWDVSFTTTLHLDDICFPKVVRSQYFGDATCSLKLLNDDYFFEVKNNDHALTIEGKGDTFRITADDVCSRGEYKDGAVHFSEALIPYGLQNFHLKSAVATRENLHITGTLDGQGVDLSGAVEVAFDSSISCKGVVEGSVDIPGSDGIKVFTTSLLPFTFDGTGVIEGGEYHFTKDGKEIAQLCVEKTLFTSLEEAIFLEGARGRIQKSEVVNLVHLLPKEDYLAFSGDIKLFPKKQDFDLDIIMERWQFELYDTGITMNSVHCKGNKKSLNLESFVPVYNDDIKMVCDVFFDEKTIFHLDGFSGRKKVLEVDGAYDDCLELMRIKGDLVGINFDITPSSEVRGSDFHIESRLDMQKMKPLLSPGALEFVERMGLEKGLEVIGGLTLDDLSFEGVINGKDFDFLDYSLASLFGKIYYHDGIFTISDFSVADRSFIASCKEAVFDTKEKGCLFQTKKFEVENLRPCLLSKKGERKKLSSPFMLEKILFKNVHGDLSNLETIKGAGSIDFINSFDKETNPVFDVAKEIIGRIGLDPVLMVPVIGHLDFQLGDGRMNFTKMVDTYSDQQRSYFFLWHKTPSYIDFNGNINIDIRMKQYVLFKFTELFIISLDGTLSSPQVHLK